MFEMVRFKCPMLNMWSATLGFPRREFSFGKLKSKKSLEIFFTSDAFQFHIVHADEVQLLCIFVAVTFITESPYSSFSQVLYNLVPIISFLKDTVSVHPSNFLHMFLLRVFHFSQESRLGPFDSV